MAAIEIDGSAMNYIDVGRGDAVLLGHGYLCNAEMWGPQLGALSRSHRVIVPDVWGHGGSGPLPRRTRDLRDLARHHLALMDKLQIGAFTLVGFSLGGMWGVELALMAPERVRGLALIGTFVGPELPEPVARYMGMLAVVEAAGAIPPEIADANVALSFSPNAARTVPHHVESHRRRLIDWDRARVRDSVIPLARMIFLHRDASADLRRLTMPVLVMTGAEDAMRPVHEWRQLAEVLGCPFVEVPGAGHLSTMENPVFVTERIGEFLRRVAAGGPATGARGSPKAETSHL